MKAKIAKISWEQFAVLGVLIIMVIMFSFTAKGFVSTTNFVNVLRQISMYGICAVGMSMVIMTNGVDLSISSTLGLVSVVSVMMMSGGYPIWMAILASLAIGALVGLANGFCVNEIGMFPMIATMGMQILVRGVALTVTGAMPQYGIPDAFKNLGQGFIGPIPVPVVIMFVLFFAGIFILNKTVYGKQIYAVGGNQEAARLSGISYKQVRYKAYIISGICAAIAGLVYSARVNSGQPMGGLNYEQDVIPACVLGGIRLGGGEGKMTGVLIGVIFMGILTNGMILFNLNEYYQMVAKGAVLLLSVAFDRITKEASMKVKAPAVGGKA